MSERKWVRRLVAGVSATAMATSFAATIGTGAANADPAESSHTDKSSQFTRVVNNTTPAIGDTITVETRFQRKSSFEDVYNIKDFHHPCLAYQTDTAKWWSTPIASVEELPATADSDGLAQVLVKPAKTTDWRVQPGAPVWEWGKFNTLYLDYKVTADCPVDIPLESTMHYGGSAPGPSGVYSPSNFNGGPSITVQAAVTTTTLAATPAPQATVDSTLTATVTGGNDGDTVTFYNNAAELGTGTVADGKAAFTWTPAAGDAGDNFVLNAEYQGSAGFVSSTSNTLPGKILDVPVTAPAQPTDLAITPANPDTDDVITVAGTTSPNTAITVTVGGTDYPGISGSDGTFSIVTGKLTAGDQTAKVVATNDAGSTSNTVDFAVTEAANDGNGGNDGSDDTGSLGNLFGSLGNLFGSLS